MGAPKKKEEKRSPLVVFCVVTTARGGRVWQEATCAPASWSVCSPIRRVRRWSPPKAEVQFDSSVIFTEFSGRNENFGCESERCRIA